MKNKTNIKKEKQLGMPIGTASNRLRKLIFFELVVATGNNICYRCGKEIETPKELTVDHKKDWLDKKNPIRLFFDLNNIAFSHHSCNAAAGKKPKKKYATEEERHQAVIAQNKKSRRKIYTTEKRRARYKRTGH